MSAIEYGSYYWCVILNNGLNDAPHSANSQAAPESIYLHADDMAVDPTGALTFTSTGRRQAGAEPPEAAQTSNGNAGAKDSKDSKAPEHSGMIYFAFAPGTWKMVYAAKLQDGSPASVEHWNASTQRPDALKNAGATDFVVPLPPK